MSEVLKTLNYEAPKENYAHLTLAQDLVRFIASNTDPVVTAFWLTNPDVYVCGGVMRAFYSGQHNREEVVKDIDLYFANQSVFELFADTMKKNGYEPSFESERAITYKSKQEDGPAIQAIKFVMGTIEEVLGEFDFTIVKCGANSSEIVMHNNFSDDLASSVLVYCGSRLPLSSLNRAFKYTARGYWLPAVQMLAILTDISESLDLANLEQVLYHLESFDPNAIQDIEIIENAT
jgi:hypothetical protein